MVLYAAAILTAAAGAMVAVGMALPIAHVATSDAFVNQPPDAVFARISDPANYGTWRPDLESVEVLGHDPLRWKEHSAGDVITYEAIERRSPDRFVSRIADDGLPFGGTWTWELRAEENGTRVTITEHGEVYHPLFRFMSRFVFSHTAAMEQVLRQLQSTSGAAVE
jgi:uncharacterized membrane protein